MSDDEWWAFKWWGMIKRKRTSNSFENKMRKDPEAEEYRRLMNRYRKEGVFVFGSNMDGFHGAGAARQAFKQYGAEDGIYFGHKGRSFAIPTKDRRLSVLTLEQIKPYIERFIKYAVLRQDLTFIVTRVGCGYSGYKDEDMAPLFASVPSNCILPDAWRKYAQ